jgi:hypothetical protein
MPPSPLCPLEEWRPNCRWEKDRANSAGFGKLEDEGMGGLLFDDDLA